MNIVKGHSFVSVYYHKSNSNKSNIKLMNKSVICQSYSGPQFLDCYLMGKDHLTLIV